MTKWLLRRDPPSKIPGPSNVGVLWTVLCLVSIVIVDVWLARGAFVFLIIAGAVIDRSEAVRLAGTPPVPVALQRQLLRLGRWRHQRGELYELVGVAVDSEHSDLVVLYRKEGDPVVYARPASRMGWASWLDTVVWSDGSERTRFAYDGAAP